MHILQRLQDLVRIESGEEEATIACSGLHVGIPGADFVFYVDILLCIKTVKPEVRDKVLTCFRQEVN